MHKIKQSLQIKSRAEGVIHMLPELSDRASAILNELIWQYGDQLGIELTYERIDPEEREERMKQLKAEKEQAV